TTPTGAAIVKTLSSGVYRNSSLTDFKIEKLGFGSGTFDIPEMPNLVRVIIADVEEPVQKEPLLLVETNIDDMNPQLYPYVMDKLFEIGVNDVYYQQIVMKKGRPGILLSVLLEKRLLNDVLNILYSETTTLGVRIFETGRHKLQREIQEVQTSMGKVKVKAVKGKGENTRFYPEFEECKRLAKELKKPVMEIQKQLIHELNI
ncbi:MAG TPA: nickel insertion protein, partial [Ignavibacteria bacterium]